MSLAITVKPLAPGALKVVETLSRGNWERFLLSDSASRSLAGSMPARYLLYTEASGSGVQPVEGYIGNYRVTYVAGYKIGRIDPDDEEKGGLVNLDPYRVIVNNLMPNLNCPYLRIGPMEIEPGRYCRDIPTDVYNLPILHV